MRNLVLFLVTCFVIISCHDKEFEIATKPVAVQQRTFYDDYSDDSTYTLEEFIQLNHDAYGDEFIEDYSDEIIDNIALIPVDTVDVIDAAKVKIKFRWRWNGCDPLGACLIITWNNAGSDPDLHDSYIGVRGNKLIVIPQSPINGMLSDGYIFVDPISIGGDEADFLGVSRGTNIVPGIYKSERPSGQFPYGYHIFDLD